MEIKKSFHKFANKFKSKRKILIIFLILLLGLASYCGYQFWDLFCNNAKPICIGIAICIGIFRYTVVPHNE